MQEADFENKSNATETASDDGELTAQKEASRMTHSHINQINK